MKRRSLFFVLFLVHLVFSGCAQSSFIKKASAFVSETSPGTEMLDDNGKPVVQLPIINYFVYVEFSGTTPEWKYAWYKDQMFTVVATKIEQNKLEIGIDKQTGKKVFVQSAKGNELWQLELLPKEKYSKPPSKLKGGELLIEGTKNKKVFHFRIPKVIFLQTPDSV
jgi:hypothetical protein